MDKHEMSGVLKTAFYLYSFEVAQSSTTPAALLPLVDGEDAVVAVHLNKNGTLRLTSIDTEEQDEKIKTLEKTVTLQKKEIKSLTATITTLEAVQPVNEHDAVVVEEPTVEMVTEKVKREPRRKP